MQRQGDQPGEDHSEQRHPPIDWRVVAPRWFLVSLIGLCFLAMGWLVGREQNADDRRIEALAKHQNDDRWDLLIKHTGQIGELERAVIRHEYHLEKLAAMAEDVRVLRKIAEAGRKKNGGYGL